MVTLLIIADDFTGALDTGVKFVAAGAAVRVITNYEYDFSQVDDRVQVLVMDAETRHITSQEAYDRVYQIVTRASQSGISYIYKKTDSALRGNIGSELAAALDATGKQVLHFLPAFPKMGRTTCGGIQYIDDVPVEDSVFGKDPFEPVVCSDVAELIRLQSDVNVAVMTDKTILIDPKEPTIAVYDAKTDEELQHLAKLLAQEEQLSVMAGCAGMAETLPDLLGLGGSVAPVLDSKPQFLVACGSVNPITKAQLDYAQMHGFRRIRLTPQQKLEVGYFETEIGRKKIAELAAEVKAAGRCILDTNDEPGGADTVAYARECGITLEVLRVRIAATLGYLLKELIEAGVEHTMLITGGDSLLGFMNEVSVYEMTPVSELEPGTVLSRFEINGKDYEVISKSGGFGNERLMVELAAKLIGEKEEVPYAWQL